MNFKKTMIIPIAIVFVIGFGTSMHHAHNDYGLAKISLCVEALADTTSSADSTNVGSNNDGYGNLYYYQHKLGEPKECTLYRNVDIHGNISFSGTDLGGQTGWTSTTVSGIKELCPKSGNGCTVYSCHVTTNTGT